MNVHVEKCRGQRCAGKIENLCAGGQRRLPRGWQWTRSCRLQSGSADAGARLFPSQSLSAVITVCMAVDYCRRTPRLARRRRMEDSARESVVVIDMCNAPASPLCYRFAMRIQGVVDLIARGSLHGRMPAQLAAQTRDLPTSKQLIEPVPGHPQRLNSLPMSMAVSPDGRYVVTVNAGYGTYESQYKQSLAVLDTQTGTLTDFPDDRTLARRASKRFIPALPSAATASHLYASMGSKTDPLGRQGEGRYGQRHCGVQLQRTGRSSRSA